MRNTKGNGVSQVQSQQPPQQPQPPSQSVSPLAKYGNTDTCRGVMRAYGLYRYNLLKSRYLNNGK